MASEEAKVTSGTGDARGAGSGAGAGAGGAGEVKSNVDGDFEYVTTQLKEYLTSHLVDSYIARKASDLVVIDCTTTAKEALKILLEKRISSAPVYFDCDDEDDYVGSRYRYLGFVDAMDLTALALAHGLETKPTGGVFDRLARFFMPDTSAVVAAAVNLSQNNPFVSVLPGAALGKVFEGMAHGYHRVAIENPDSGEIIGLITQSQMIRMLAGHRPLLGAFADKPLGEIFKLGPKFKEVYCISQLAAASLALNRMIELRIGGMPLLDDKFRIVTNISASDIRSMGAFKPGHFSVLDAPCIEFVTAMRTKREQETIKAGKRLGPLAPSNGGVARAITMSPSDTFGTLINMFAFSKLHRIYVVNSEQVPIGVVTLTDVFRTLVKPLAPNAGAARPAPTAAAAQAAAASVAAASGSPVAAPSPAKAAGASPAASPAK